MKYGRKQRVGQKEDEMGHWRNQLMEYDGLQKMNYQLMCCGGHH